ncbi:cupin domain-containing protein [Isachenkonia alkalipeptolytica]|uniref:Cupin domain-containing protein n=1 Tax=Isachenkonia alkalipeptolytica TaxID=2565777 RepID=A0AA44BE70_9CLOT|nr:cupin domain-containing protein [Isachenkonia alkalipeptolytica]NBG87870.1 cupin domain-containing protein [Isachenkonia alkalipeptolytica]
MEPVDILDRMAKHFQNMIDEAFCLNIKLKIEGSEEYFNINIENGNVLLEDTASKNVDCTLVTSEEVLQKIHRGEITAFTAAGKAHVSDPAPLDWEIEGGYNPENMKNLYFFLMHFFNVQVPEKINLGEKYARKVHGANAIPLYYNPGFRSAWYMVKKGEQMNEPGDTDPFHQAIIVIEGKGYAKIGNKSVEIEKNESYYIPPKGDQVVWNDSEEPLVLIWLAWGDEA